MDPTSEASANDQIERLYRSYHAPIVRYLTRRLGDRDLAEELAQETFMRAMRYLESHETVSSERSWLFAVATNLVRDEARRDSRQRRHLELLRNEAADDVQEPETTSLERLQEAALARRAVDALAERDRIALLMKEEGLDYHEIAAALGLSVGSVGTTLSRARRRLVEVYEALQRDGQSRANGGIGG
jgi:RNA polymerase sigma-70 factor (ECF subfamily)